MSTSSADRPSLDVDRLVSVLARHEVEYLLAGGVATRLYGATRLTRDSDCLAHQTRANLARLCEATKGLGAHLRVAGMSDEDAAALPAQLDPETIVRLQVSTRRTDGGDLDVLVDIPSSDGARRSYEDLVSRSEEVPHAGAVVRVASLEDIVASKRAVGREKDLDAPPELGEILALQRRRNRAGLALGADTPPP